MNHPYICVAGFEATASGKNNVSPGKCVRPVKGRLDKALLHTFKLGAIVNLGSTTCIGRPPETEDYSFEPTSASLTKRVSKDQFWEIMESKAERDLKTVFGPALQRHETTHGIGGVVIPGSGKRSLGEIRLQDRPNLYENDFGRLRIKVPDTHFPRLDLPVNDLRFYQSSKGDWALNTSMVQKIGQRLRKSSEIILAVGLTREYRGFHWLQVNNVYFKDDSLWEGSLGSN
jgi:hypothetical protein